MRKNQNRKGERGFTLVELLFVVVILGLLASLALPNLFRQGAKARMGIAKSQIATLGTALDAYALDTGRYPSTEEGLDALISAPAGESMWDGPVLEEGRAERPLGQRLRVLGRRRKRHVRNLVLRRRRAPRRRSR